MRVSIHGHPVFYREQGTGPVLVLLHGWGVHSGVYQTLIDDLSQRYRVLAPDFPGCGQTPEPQSPWTLADYVDFVTGFCAALAVKEAVLVGHSHGARTILALLPQTTLFVPKAVLFGAAGLRTKHGLSWYLKVYTYKAGKAALAPFPALRDKWAARSGSADYRQATPIMRATMSNLLSEDVYDRLPHIKTPTLLIFGENDSATPVSAGKRMEAAIPGSGLVIVPGAGHYPFLDAPGFCRRVLNSFLG